VLVEARKEEDRRGVEEGRREVKRQWF